MPLVQTRGAASAQGFGEFAVVTVPNYIEDVFSTYLYTGNGSTQTITNGIDLSGQGGLVWLKGRSVSAVHTLVDTARGAGKTLFSDLTNAQATNNAVSAFNSNGFTMGDYNNTSPDTYASWTFRKQPKFFDVVTYTGNGTSGRTVAHNLGSVPGCIIVKKTSSSSTYGWCVYHRSLTSGSPFNLCLNTTDSQGAIFNGDVYSATDTTFSVSSLADVNQSGQTFVAYLFAHDAGGFGLTGTDNVISCGSYTGTGSSVTVDIGYEPQWILTRNVTDADDWFLFDNMRGIATGGTDAFLRPNLSNAENTATDVLDLTATGFKTVASARHTNGKTYIYIAIRRGPMKVPTSGTSVFSPNTATGNGTSNTLTTNFPVDLSVDQPRAGTGPAYWIDRLRGGTQYINSASTTAETTHGSALIGFQSNTTLIDANYGSTTDSYVNWAFRRAPSFFDEVCYTGTDPTPQNITHNLGVAPELMIVKVRSSAGDDWIVYCSKVTDANIVNLRLNKTQAIDYNGDMWDATTPTATTFRVGQSVLSNYGGQKLVAYLFATCAGVSKVGSYTGTATTKQIDCGFTAGARFVLIKRTDSTGDWYVWDSARGIVAGNDPYLLLNSSAAEVTSTDYIDTYSAGFELSSTAPAAINASGGTFIFLAIA